MVKINCNKFDYKVIDKIYDELVEDIIIRFNKYSINSNSNQLVIEFFKNEFGIKDTLDKDKIKKFLYFKIKEIDEIIDKINNFKNTLDNTLDKKILSELINFTNLSHNLKLDSVSKKLKSPMIFNSWKNYLDCHNKKVAKKDEKLTVQLSYDFILDKYPEYNNMLSMQKDIGNIINYDILGDKARHDLLVAMNVTVCPYCNRTYISNWKDEKDAYHSTADIDHFYNQSMYPIASLSLYNFIPSCQICNSRFKGTKDFFKEKHIYPYEEYFGDNAKFTFDGIDYLINNEFDFSIKTDKKNDFNAKINMSLSTFRINEIYKSHNNFVKDLVDKSNTYKYSLREELKYNLDFLFYHDNLKLLVFGNPLTEDDIDQNTLLKLKKDILEDLKIY